MTTSPSKTIDTLVPDIEETLVKGVSSVPDELLDKYSILFRNLLETRLRASERQRRRTLRMSNVGKPCERQLWYEIQGEGGESLPPSAYMKFLYGDLIEILLLFLAEVSGHEVKGTQDEQEIEGIKGHRDAVIDGVTVDVKSASSYSFKKFEEGTLSQNDPFGYEDQLQSYIYSGQSDPEVRDKDRGAFLVADKVLGHLCLDIHKRNKLPYNQIYQYKKEMVSGPKPNRGFDPIPEGKSGNEKLPVNCSYCAFKHSCHPSLRTFLYSSGPVFLTTVMKEPNVPEIT